MYGMWAHRMHRYRRNYLTLEEKAKIAWINELKPYDKLDVMIHSAQYSWSNRWKAVTVISLEDAYVEDEGRYGYYSERTVQDLCVEYNGSDPSLASQFTINIYDRNVLNVIAKLYTYSAIHNDAVQYYNDEFSACYPHCQLQKGRSYRRLKCIHCEVPFCRKCNVAAHIVLGNKFECKPCCIKREYDQIFDALSFVFRDKDIDDGSDHFWITRFISTLSIGAVVECGNFMTCAKEICINNAYELDGYVDYKRHKISHYTIDNAHKLRDNLKYSVIYGQYRRIFCSDCTANVIQRCQHTNCDTRDIFVNNKTEIGKEMYIICGDHLYCESCNFVPLSNYHLSQCIQCRMYCCSQCHLNRICRLCMEKKEISYFAQALYDIIGDVLYTNLIGIVAAYAIGKFMNCCNLRGCMNTVCIRNQSDLMANIDADHNDIYWYKATKRCKANAISIYDELIIIFCSDCTKHTLKDCRYQKYHNSMKGQCRNKEASNDICQLHPRCYVCGKASESRQNIQKCKENDHCSNYQCAGCKCTEYCSECIISRETKHLVNIIKQSLHMDDTIYTLIANYSLGCIVKCCNDVAPCHNEISINNEYELESFLDADHQDISHYTPVFPHRSVMIYGKERRIFCTWCTANDNRLKSKCKYCGFQGDTNECCQNHKVCTFCKEVVWYVHEIAKCKKCDQTCCKACVYKGRCPKCFERKEQMKLIQTLKESAMNIVNDDKILEITASYGVGYIVTCCNEECTRDVIVNNRSVLLLRNGKRIYQYIVTTRVSKILETVELYGHKRRIFCEICTNGALIHCRYIFRNKHCGRRETAFDNSFKCTYVCHKHHCEYKGHCFRCSKMLPNWEGKIYPYCVDCSGTYEVWDSDQSDEYEDGNNEDKKYRATADFVLSDLSIEKYEKTKLFEKHYKGKYRTRKDQKAPRRARCKNRKKTRSYFKHKTDKIQNTLSKQRYIRKQAKHILELEY